VVDQLHEALTAALDAAAAQEERFAALPETAVDPFAGEVAERLRQRLEAMQACCQRAKQAQFEAEAALGDAADGIVGWLAEVGPARRTLADGPARAVS
jgi:hypothetical protein